MQSTQYQAPPPPPPPSNHGPATSPQLGVSSSGHGMMVPAQQQSISYGSHAWIPQVQQNQSHWLPWRPTQHSQHDENPVYESYVLRRGGKVSDGTLSWKKTPYVTMDLISSADVAMLAKLRRNQDHGRPVNAIVRYDQLSHNSMKVAVDRVIRGRNEQEPFGSVWAWQLYLLDVQQRPLGNYILPTRLETTQIRIIVKRIMRPDCRPWNVHTPPSANVSPGHAGHMVPGEQMITYQTTPGQIGLPPTQQQLSDTPWRQIETMGIDRAVPHPVVTLLSSSDDESMSERPMPKKTGPKNGGKKNSSKKSQNKEVDLSAFEKKLIKKASGKSTKKKPARNKQSAIAGKKVPQGSRNALKGQKSPRRRRSPSSSDESAEYDSDPACFSEEESDDSRTPPTSISNLSKSSRRQRSKNRTSKAQRIQSLNSEGRAFAKLDRHYRDYQHKPPAPSPPFSDVGEGYQEAVFVSDSPRAMYMKGRRTERELRNAQNGVWTDYWV